MSDLFPMSGMILFIAGLCAVVSFGTGLYVRLSENKKRRDRYRMGSSLQSLIHELEASKQVQSRKFREIAEIKEKENILLKQIEEMLVAEKR